MKFCNNCGEKLKNGELYCPNCGKEVGKEIVIKENKEGLGTASMVIGIISLVLSFIINLGAIPIALIGLILGIVNKAQKGKKVSGIILNTIAMILSVVVFIVIIVLFIVHIPDIDTHIKEPVIEEPKQEEVLGVWNCKDISSIADNTYELTLTINNDNTFILAKYDTPKDYIEGTYEFEENDIDRFVKPYHLYSIELEGKKEYKNGDYKGEIDVDYDMVITKTKKDMHAVISNDDTDKPYYCTK